MRHIKWSVFLLALIFSGAVFGAAEEEVVASVDYFYAQDGTLIGRAVNGVRVNYEYDKRGQLLAVKDADGKDLERYTYDPAGNRLSKTVKGITTTYTYDEANQLKTSTVNGKTTHYRYDAAGRLVQAGERTYHYGANDKVTEICQDGRIIAQFEYFMDGQLAVAKYPDRVEHFTWDGLALVERNDVKYINEPYVTGGNPILANNDVMFNDMLGSTLAINDKSVGMTSFGESEDVSAFFTGKPHVEELGYAFLFRNYRADYGKWQTADPLGYPDGWNNFAYCKNKIDRIDALGLAERADTFAVICAALYLLPFKNIAQVTDYGPKGLECYHFGGNYLKDDSDFLNKLAPIEASLKNTLENETSPKTITRSIAQRWSNTKIWKKVLDTGTINIQAYGTIYNVENGMKEYQLVINYEFIDEVDFRGINHGEFPGWNQINNLYELGGTFGALGETLLDWVFDGGLDMNYYVRSTWSKTIKWRAE